MSTDRWTDKEDAVHRYGGMLFVAVLLLAYPEVKYYSVIKKDEMPFVTTWVDLEGIIPSQISQKKTNIIWLYLYVQSKKQNKHHKAETDSELQRSNWCLPEGVVYKTGEGD